MAARSRWDQDRFRYGICDVSENYDFYFKWLLGKLHNVFVWENLPETVDETFLNNELFLSGMVCWTEFNGKLYALNGGYGGEPNEYYRPTKFVIANPVLGSKQVKIGEDGVVMFNSDVDKDFGQGLFQLIKQTATLLADNIVSINCAQINGRVQAIYTADTTALKNSAQAILKRLYAGEPYQVIDQDIINKLEVNPMAATAGGVDVQKLTELHQYLISQFYQNIGIKSNGVMKKERLITGEIDSQEDFLAISIEVMLKAREEAVKAINEMFGTDIRVSINPILVPQVKEEEKAENSAKEITEESTLSAAELSQDGGITDESEGSAAKEDRPEEKETKEAEAEETTEEVSTEEVSTEEVIETAAETVAEVLEEAVEIIEGGEEKEEKEDDKDE